MEHCASSSACSRRMPLSRTGSRSFGSRGRVARPAPSNLDKFIENPTHTQTSLLLSQQNINLTSEAAVPATAFGRSVSRLRESALKPAAEPPDLEENDGLPLLGLPSTNRCVTDGIQKHAPPLAPEGKSYVLEPEKFEYGFVEPPKYRLVKDLAKPKNEFLQSPAERQQRMLFQKLTRDAKKQLHDDNQKEVRLLEQMKNAFPRGALNSECPVTENSLVYAPTIQAIDEKAWKKYTAAEQRHHDLLGNLSRVQYSKYDPLKEGEAAGPWTQEDKCFQSKSRVQGMNSFQISTKTHDVKASKPSRTQNIRNCQSKGRPYDIISGIGYEFLPPTVGERLDARQKRGSHPSLSSRFGVESIFS